MSYFKQPRKLNDRFSSRSQNLSTRGNYKGKQNKSRKGYDIEDERLLCGFLLLAF